MRAAALAIVCLLLSGVADAQTAAAPDAPASSAPTTAATAGAPRDLRGAQAPVSPPPAAAPFSPIPSGAGYALPGAGAPDPGDHSGDPLGETSVDQCREGCARTYYICLSGDDSSGCPEDWTSCRASCLRSPQGSAPAGE